MLDKRQEYLLSSLDVIRDDYIAEAANFTANANLEYDTMELVVDGSNENKSTGIVPVEELTRRKKIKKLYGTLGTLAACFVLVVSLGIYQMQDKMSDTNGYTDGAGSIEQIPENSDPGASKENSSGNDMEDISDTVSLGEQMPTQEGTSGASSLMWYEPEEIFAQNIAIVRGTVEDIKTVEGTPLQGEEGHVTYTLITVRTENCLKGNLTQGETITIRLPIVVSESNRGSEDIKLDDYYDGLYCLEIGSDAIFMPRVSEQGEYYFSEGRRYLFLATEDGVSYADEVYTPKADGPITLDRIEDYILDVMSEGS